MNVGGEGDGSLPRLLRQAANEGKALVEAIEAVTPAAIARHLYMASLPDPDLIIRKSGENRLSGFLLWRAPIVSCTSQTSTGLLSARSTSCARSAHSSNANVGSVAKRRAPEPRGLRPTIGSNEAVREKWPRSTGRDRKPARPTEASKACRARNVRGGDEGDLVAGGVPSRRYPRGREKDQDAIDPGDYAQARGVRRAGTLTSDALLYGPPPLDYFSAYSAYAKAMIDYKEDVGKEFARRKKLNPSEPDPIPHPDDIVFNSSTGKVELYGPMTKEERVLWDRIEETDAAIAELEGMLAKDPDNPDNKFIEEELAQKRRVRKLLARAVPDYRPRPSWREARQKARLRAFKSFLEHSAAAGPPIRGGSDK
jgi:hypothetical protein